MEFVVLGPVEVRDDSGRGVALGGPKPRALLAMLLLAGNEVVSRDRLVDGLWGERPPASAGHSLDHYVSRLRRALGEDRIDRRAPGYVLHVAPGELDAERFEALRRQGGDELARGEAGAAATTLTTALALWRGPALADLLYEPFAAVEAEHLEERRLLAIEDRIDAELALGAGAELVPELERLVAEHPLRERAIGQLMLALYRAGRQAEALEAYAAARRRLTAELGLEPGNALRELERAILDHDVAPARPRAAGPAAVVRGARARGAALLAAVVAVAGVAAVVLARGPEATSAAAGPRLVMIDAGSSAVGRSVVVPAAPTTVTADGNSVWVAEPGRNGVLRVDAAAGTIVDRVALAAQPADIAAAPAAVWVTSALGGTLTRIDRETDEVTQTIDLGGAGATAVAAAGTSLWVAEGSARRLVQLDAASGRVRRRVALGFEPAALAIARGTLWVADYGAGTVTRLSPASGQPVATVHVGQGPVALAARAGDVWVANSLDGTVSRIDVASGAVSATIAVGSGPADIEIAHDAVWVANAYSGTIARVDPTAGRVTRTVRVGGRPTSIAVGPRAIWAGVDSLAETHTGGTLRLASTQRFASVDPALNYFMGAAQFGGLAYDALVTFTHAPGKAGLRLVPDLAVALPTVSDGGRTYAFRVRPGVRYSDGRTVRAGDFRRAIERLFRAHSTGTAVYDGLAGAHACARLPSRCDLARGVATDDRAGTVVFRLAAPDPDFLYGLTSYAFSAPVPPGTPDPRSTGNSVVPATGPYRMQDANEREVRFVRNRYFHEWSHAAQPAGHPDEIQWRFERSHDATVDAIEHGHADWTFDLIPPAQLRRIEQRDPGLLHKNASFFVEFIPLNAHARPFDDVRVRRALNYAIDRAKVARMYGGPTVATPTCQPLAPGLPGYVAYCPYTRRGARDGGWSAPDLARGRRLIAASGRRGASVDVWGTTDEVAIPAELPSYVAGVLRSLGLHARLHRRPTASLTMDRRRSLQLSVDGDWGPDFPAPSAYLPQFFGCGASLSNGYFCDPELDARMRRARALQLADPRRAGELWSRIDHAIVDRAPWVPLVNLRGVDLVSHRLGNFTYHALWGFLPDQAWLR